MTSLSRRLSAALAAAALAVAAIAATAAGDTADADELDLDRQLHTPAIPQRQHAATADHAARLAASMRRQGLRAATLRQSEIVLVSLPCDTLFAANSTTPKPEALRRLRPLREIVGQSERYKVVVAVHSDDTGDDAYSDALTEARANAIDDLLWQLADRDDDTNVVIYGIGKDEPLHDNDSQAHRRANRRVEIYIVPLPH